MNVTDRQTTDGRAIAYSEREFTFAKKFGKCDQMGSLHESWAQWINYNWHSVLSYICYTAYNIYAYNMPLLSTEYCVVRVGYFALISLILLVIVLCQLFYG